MSATIPPFPQYTFMGWCSVKKSTGTTLPLDTHTHTHTQNVPNAGSSTVDSASHGRPLFVQTHVLLQG